MIFPQVKNSLVTSLKNKGSERLRMNFYKLAHVQTNLNL